MSTDCLYCQISHPLQRLAADWQFVEAPLWPTVLACLSMSIPGFGELLSSSFFCEGTMEPFNLTVALWIPELQCVGKIGCGPFGVHGRGKQLPTVGRPTSRRFSETH